MFTKIFQSYIIKKRFPYILHRITVEIKESEFHFLPH